MTSHTELSNWYAQLGQHLEAGVLLSDALRLCKGLPTAERTTMAERLEEGVSFPTVLADAPKWLPPADRQFLLAGWETGNLTQTLANLSARHAEIGASQLKLLLGLTYPLVVLHITIGILPIARMIDFENGLSWSLPQYLLETASLLTPTWCIIATCIYLVRSQHPWLPHILRRLPILKTYSEAQALADLAYSLGTFIAAGVPVPSAWRLSSKLVNDTRYTQATEQLESTFAAGAEPSNKLQQFDCFPADFLSFYQTGARSGQLDTNLLIIGREYQARANRAMTRATIIYPALLLAVIAALVIYTTFSIFGAYLQIFENFDS
ncbi:type II secretion system F family protein [Coraliomargarita sp. SDUM461004]|uniref:Type II secretion system F family protein n=1 Tax=Thalassobacterium sedimentorum TaxID=3041258 RepID=A0ABU1AK15_9BACT|nr:type II secretion system F family protein [Coraliomargarita sp. SDUM461004]MDQ8195136.1 type II secretion system F family protein [Coraliomargarita sp. SDUM461004]